jgi:hypothetical protein
MPSLAAVVFFAIFARFAVKALDRKGRKGVAKDAKKAADRRTAPSVFASFRRIRTRASLFSEAFQICDDLPA